MKAGDKIIDSEGYGLIFRKTARDTNGELLEMEAFYRPHGPMPPPHFHPNQKEQFQVLGGEFEVRLEDQLRTYKAGERFEIPAGTSHAMRNVSGDRGHLLWQTRPALQSEGFFETVWSMEQDGQHKSGWGRLLHLAVIFQAYQREVQLSQTGKRALLKLLAPLGRLAGYRATRA